MTTGITDTRVYVETPEGADLPMDPAGVGVRIAAYLIDFLIRVGVVVLLSMVLAYADKLGEGLLLICYFLIDWFYPVYFEVWRGGATPGKKAMGILVVNVDGSPVSFSSSLIRNLLRFVDSFPVIFYVPALVCCLCNKRFQRLGDLAAATMVIYAQAQQARPHISEPGKASVPTDFNLEEQRALIAFAERSENLSPDRQKELADVLMPVLKVKDPIKTIKQMANTLVGGRE